MSFERSEPDESDLCSDPAGIYKRKRIIDESITGIAQFYAEKYWDWVCGQEYWENRETILADVIERAIRDFKAKYEVQNG